MKLPFLASFIVFIVWLSFTITRSRRVMENQEKAFWEREKQANRTRKKSLDGLHYITIPLDTLPMDVCADHEAVKECLDIIQTLSEQTIVNLTGYTNTDLKLMYGAPNITALTCYDQNYTLLARTLQKWASLLHEQGYIAQARTILEFAISTHTDVSGTYRLLSSIYRAAGEPEKNAYLLEVARTLNGASKNIIVRILQESDPSDD
ncbi:MAG: hypothetical protein HFI91_05990 [Lachnospiraceae bacterium]|jgi:hypothetical protein|nr:hypothetical protein [Lachnospiraceae bacterium]